MLRLLLVDGHAYAYRAFHAIRSLRSPSGRPTNAVFGFIKMLDKLRAKLEPSHLLVVWDGGLSAERMAALPGYKAQRPDMPADLAEQLDEIWAFLSAAGVASYCGAGVEADDYIACVARRASRAGVEVVVASSDKDFMQLVTPEGNGQWSVASSNGRGTGAPGGSAAAAADCGLRTADSGRIGLFNPNDKSELVWGAEQVRGKAGVAPGQIVDWLALVGDSVDNIPGVPGVGVKTAAELLNQFGSVAGLYARLDEVRSERLRAALKDAAAVVRRNVELVRLKDELPCRFELDEWQEQPAEVESLRELFARWGFRSMLAELESNRQAVLL